MSTVSIVKLFKSAEESVEPERVPIKGKLPEWLKGTYYRVGPAKFDIGDFTMNHLLDGYAMISKFKITGNEVIFEKKFLQSDSYKRAVAAQKPVITEFGTPACSDPHKTMLSKFVTAIVPEFTDNDYSTLFSIGSDLFSVCDTCFFRQVDTENLGESPEKHDSNKFFGVNGQSAHPLTDSNGDIWNIGFTLFTGLKFQIVKIPARLSAETSSSGSSPPTSKELLKQAKIVATVPSRWTGSIGTLHSFGMSDKHIIFVEQPLVATMSKLLAALVKKTCVRDWLEWKGEDKNRFVVISKTGKVYKTDFYSRDSFYFMHTVNCFEEEGQIVVDIITYASASVLDIFYLTNLRQNVIKHSELPQLQRFVIPLIEDVKQVPEGENLVRISSTSSTPHKATAFRHGNKIILNPENVCEDKGLEFPSMNPGYRGLPYKYAYAAGTINVNEFRNKVCKVNFETKQVLKFTENEHVFPGEPLFIPKPGGAAEDDGIVLAAMTDTKNPNNDFILFLDKEMEEVGRATFRNDIPSAFHGIFLRD